MVIVMCNFEGKNNSELICEKTRNDAATIDNNGEVLAYMFFTTFESRFDRVLHFYTVTSSMLTQFQVVGRRKMIKVRDILFKDKQTTLIGVKHMCIDSNQNKLMVFIKKDEVLSYLMLYDPQTGVTRIHKDALQGNRFVMFFGFGQGQDDLLVAVGSRQEY